MPSNQLPKRLTEDAELATIIMALSEAILSMGAELHPHNVVPHDRRVSFAMTVLKQQLGQDTALRIIYDAQHGIWVAPVTDLLKGGE